MATISSDKKVIPFKRGDDFLHDMTVKNKNSVGALAALATLTASQAQLVLDQATLDAAIAAIPYVAQDETDAQAAYDATAAQIVIDQAAYDAAIVVDITGWTITSELSWCDAVEDTLVVTMVNEPLGQFRLSRDSTLTAAWKKRLLDADIRFDIPGLGKRSSKTFYVDLRES